MGRSKKVEKDNTFDAIITCLDEGFGYFFERSVSFDSILKISAPYIVEAGIIMPHLN